MPGPVEVGEDHPLAGSDAAVRRALAAAVGARRRAARAGGVLEGDGAAVERGIDDGRVRRGAVDHGREPRAATRVTCGRSSADDPGGVRCAIHAREQ